MHKLCKLQFNSDFNFRKFLKKLIFLFFITIKTNLNLFIEIISDYFFIEIFFRVNFEFIAFKIKALSIKISNLLQIYLLNSLLKHQEVF